MISMRLGVLTIATWLELIWVLGAFGADGRLFPIDRAGGEWGRFRVKLIMLKSF